MDTNIHQIRCEEKLLLLLQDTTTQQIMEQINHITILFFLFRKRISKENIRCYLDVKTNRESLFIFKSKLLNNNLKIQNIKNIIEKFVSFSRKFANSILKKSWILNIKKTSENLIFPLESFVPQSCLATLYNKEIRCQGQFDYFL